jgi:hypothetical protein
MTRLFLTGTPRSGNTWLRRLLVGALELQEFAVHRPTDLDWDSLPDRCVVGLHWLRADTPEAMLSERGFRSLLVVRHPLDVLISVLHFCGFNESTRQWLDGMNGDETGIIGTHPTSAAFRDYCLSDRAAALLSVGVSWSDPSGREPVPIVRYERLVADPVGEMRGLLRTLGEPERAPLADVVELNELHNVRRSPSNEHFWHFWIGHPGYWKRLLPAPLVGEIAERHAHVFDALGYSCDADPALTVQTADANWAQVARPLTPPA